MALEKKVRIPFIPLDISNADIGEFGELIVDKSNKEIYIKSKTDGELISIPTNERIKEKIDSHISDLLDSVDIDGNNLEKLYILTQNLEDIMNYHISNNKSMIVDNLYKIINLFSDYSKDDPTILELLDNKMVAEKGKTLTQVNLTDEKVDKILSIEEGSNEYIHPMNPECDIKDIVYTVNDATGNVNIRRDNIYGLEGVHPQANFYEHPERKECTHSFNVNTVNSKSGNVVLTKSDIGLNNVKNFKIAGPVDIDDGVLDLYLTPAVVHQYIKEKLKIV